jgi:outer membrane protein OmpA-like peptidoglycan-associated protein
LIRWLPFLLVLTLCGCAGVTRVTGVTERIVLLPAADGHASALVVKTAKDEALMTVPLSVVEIREGRIVERTLGSTEVQERYGPVIKALPPVPRVYTVYFHFERTSLLPQSRALLDNIKAEAERMPAAEIVITGHTDRVGGVAFNDDLSLRRARVVGEIFLSIGVPASSIRLEARGEREPLVPTGDEVAEPRNRRVVIKIR